MMVVQGAQGRGQGVRAVDVVEVFGARDVAEVLWPQRLPQCLGDGARW